MTREEKLEIRVHCAKMEEMDHETSVNVDVEEPTTSVNVYGSPVAAHGRRNEESAASTSYAVHLANVNRVVSSILHFLRERIAQSILS